MNTAMPACSQTVKHHHRQWQPNRTHRVSIGDDGAPAIQHHHITRWWVDMPAVCLLAALFYLFELSHWIEPRHTAIHCAGVGDLRWPYRAHQTINDDQLIIATFGMPMAFVGARQLE